MKLKYVLSNLLKNRMALNIISILSVISIIGYLMTNNLNAIAYFIALGIIALIFSKNMIIVLGVPLVLVNFFFSANAVKEGLENISDSSNKSNNSDNSKKSSDSNGSTTTTKKKSQETTKTPQGLPKTKLDSDVVMNSTNDSADFANGGTDESFEVGRVKRGGGGYNVDYASTVEDAYDELNKIIGGDGIKRLTNDTQNLMKQQLQLADAMKGMGPLIENMAPLMEQAQGLLKGMGTGKDGLGDIMKMAEQFKPK